MVVVVVGSGGVVLVWICVIGSWERERDKEEEKEDGREER